MSVAINGTNGITYNDGSLQASAPVGRNLIINGNMQIAQRGTTGTPGAGGSYLASDRWKAWDASDAVVTVSQETDGPTGQFTKCLKYNVTTADASITTSQFGMVRQMIEGYNIIDLGFGTASAQSVTISFWVKSSLTGSHGAALNNGNDDRSYPFAYTISVANTWEYKTVTIAGDTSGTWDTDNTAGMIITFGMGTGSQYEGTADAWQAGQIFQPTSTVANIGTISNWNVTGVQLEANTTATPFENLQYGQQLALCLRYLPVVQATNYVATGMCFSATNARCSVQFPVPSRVSPTGFTTTGAISMTTNNGSGTGSIVWANASTLMASLSATGLSGLVAGDATALIGNQSILFTGCEL
jgi:hypothetical protein